MDRSTPPRLWVRCAGQDWVLEFDRERIRDEVARWLGPWARALPDQSPRPGGAGLARFVSCTRLPAGVAGIRRHPEGIGVRTLECEFLTRETARTATGEIRFREGTAVGAAGLALRILVMRVAFARGAVALHAASVRTAKGALVFVGPSGAGKTAARGAFPPHERLDDDLVLLAKSDGRWVRLDLFDKESPQRFGPTPRVIPVRAVLRPEPGDRFRFIPLSGGEAFRACFHVPAFICVPGGERAVEDASALLERLNELIEAVPVARFEWALGEDLPALLEGPL